MDNLFLKLLQVLARARVDDGRLSEDNIVNLLQDLGQRGKLSDAHPDDKDLARRTYLQRKPFKGDNTVGGDAFVCDGFRAWNRLQTIQDHASKHMSAHHKVVVTAMELFKKQKGSIITALSKQTAETRSAYRKRLEASITAIRWLLLQGLPFRGHDEKESSLNRGNFISLLTLLLEHDVEYSKVVFKMAPGNYQLTSPGIQKDIIHACAKETTKAILEDLADESVDVFDKEQLVLCLRYVSKKGEVCERFLGIVHVANTHGVFFDFLSSSGFSNLKNLNEISVKLVETGKHETHERAYLLLKLVLTLPVQSAWQLWKEYFLE
ncbi:zinc finger MYM-type protein 1-like [Chenopodium quinoa]|uniref:zinc finger MYM-type protein 1-like n=1 Tax=Chenopodium quinoa TaxID=63459 RepID=UPI000B77D34B|nr:zinc finger MYM-type protein 1-like [Chenopodium quinoa]